MVIKIKFTASKNERNADSLKAAFIELVSYFVARFRSIQVVYED